MSDIQNRIAEVKEKIRLAAQRKNRPPEGVRLVAVSKTVEIDRIREAVEGGAIILGESRVQEARDKIQALGREGIQWHLIGHLQKNKVKYIYGLFDLVHSVDSLELAEEINHRGALMNRRMDILVQVNIGHDQAKFGTDPEKALDLVKKISRLKNLSVKGLMAIPPYYEDPEESRPHYTALRELRDWLTTQGFGLPELSMGMSHDFEAAVEEGATLVRVGSAIFGERIHV